MMTRQEALKYLKEGKTLITVFTPEQHGVSSELEVRIEIQQFCVGFSPRRMHEHTTIGPIHVRLWQAGNPHWIHINSKQLRSFLDRNYPNE